MNHQQLAVVVALATIVAGIGAAVVVPSLGADDGSAGPAAQVTQGETTVCDYQAVFDRTIESVVSIRTNAGQGSGFVYQVGENASVNGSLDTATAGDGTETIEGTETATAGNGSTVSYVLTNAHVVADATTVQVQFDGGESAAGEIVGASTYTDLAIVRVNETPGYVDALDVAADDPERGRAVAALGNPFGLDRTITHGIVSGLDRSMPTDRGFQIPNVVQTDAPISPGNSGGPLVTCDGAVVGVNTAGIASPQAENVGFAVSASVIRNVVPSLVADGEFAYPYLGIGTRAVTPTVAEVNDLDVSSGVMVASVVESGPAAGVLQPREDRTVVDDRAVPVGGDVILAVGGQEISTSEDLGSYLITETSPGDTVSLTVLRDGQRTNVSVTLGERPEPGTA